MSDSAAKPRVRVAAGKSKRFTTDTFVNFQAGLGYGAQNLISASTYGFNPLTRNHVLLEWMYRGSWLVRKVVDAPANDMTREGIEIESDMPPEAIDRLTKYWQKRQIWQRLRSTLKWSRLYGGCLAVFMIEGQDPSQPLRLDTIGKNQFKGLLVLDRWMVWPSLEDLVTDFGPDYGKPKYYAVVADARIIPTMKVHHSRCIRFDGVELPYWQSLTENMWGLSIMEPMYDRIIAWDSVTAGAAQLVYKAHLRTLSIENLRELIATGEGGIYNAVLQQIQNIRLMQTNEGLTVIDSTDKFEAHQYTFAGLSDMMIQFSQQVSGSCDVPMTRLFGQSPAGLNSTGDSDLRNYYDMLKGSQESEMRGPVEILLDVSHRSLFGFPLPKDFNFSFKPLWQLTMTEKAETANQIVTAVTGLQEAGIFSAELSLKEVRQWSRITSFGTNITDEDIEEAQAEPPAMQALMGEGGEENSPKPTPTPPTGEKPAAGAESSDERIDPSVGLINSSAQIEQNELPDPGSSMEAGYQSSFDPQTPIEINYNGVAPPITGTGALSGKVGGKEISSRAMTYDHANDLIPKDQFSFIRDRQPHPIVEVHGLQVYIETPKGERRLGYGWSIQMPCDYGYISGTSSEEGPQEQMDAFVGDELDAPICWVIEQHEPESGAFDEHKVMLGFPTKQAALNAYLSAFDDCDQRRIGNVRQMHISVLKQWLQDLPYGKTEGS